MTAGPLSPHEESVLAGLEEEVRADDPAFADVLGSGRPPAPPPLLRAGQVLGLAAALAGLAVAGTVGAERLGPLGLAAATGLVTVPWLVGAARSAERRARTTTAPPRRRRRSGSGPVPPRTLLLGTALALATIAVLPASWQAVVGLTLMFALLPVVAWVVLRRPGRRGR